MPKTYYSEEQIHNMVSIVVGDEGRLADEVVACLKQEFNEHLESEVDGYVQSLVDKARCK